MLDRHFDDLRKLLVALVLEADIARIDPVFVERLGAGGMVGKQFMADVVKVADQGNGDAHLRQPVADMGHGGGGFVAVDGDAHQFGARPGERGDLARGSLDIGGVGIGHRLDDDRRAGAHRHGAGSRADAHADAPVAGRAGRRQIVVRSRSWDSRLLRYGRNALDHICGWPSSDVSAMFLLHRPFFVISVAPDADGRACPSASSKDRDRCNARSFKGVMLQATAPWGEFLTQTSVARDPIGASEGSAGGDRTPRLGRRGAATGKKRPRSNANDFLAAALGGEIIAGVYPPGSRLPGEAILLERFKVSRPTLREAFRVLAAKGLIVSRQKVGTSVRPKSDWNMLDPDFLAWHLRAALNEDFVNDLFQLRQMVEPQAAYLAALSRDPAALERISAAYADMEASQGRHRRCDGRGSALPPGNSRRDGQSVHRRPWRTDRYRAGRHLRARLARRRFDPRRSPASAPRRSEGDRRRAGRTRRASAWPSCCAIRSPTCAAKWTSAAFRNPPRPA